MYVHPCDSDSMITAMGVKDVQTPDYEICMYDSTVITLRTLTFKVYHYNTLIFLGDLLEK